MMKKYRVIQPWLENPTKTIPFSLEKKLNLGEDRPGKTKASILTIPTIKNIRGQQENTPEFKARPNPMKVTSVFQICRSGGRLSCHISDNLP